MRCCELQTGWSISFSGIAAFSIAKSNRAAEYDLGKFRGGNSSVRRSFGIAQELRAKRVHRAEALLGVDSSPIDLPQVLENIRGDLSLLIHESLGFFENGLVRRKLKVTHTPS